MKKWIVIIFAMASLAFTWYPANEKTIGWDAYPLADPADQVLYAIWIKSDADGLEVEIDRVAATTYTFSAPSNRGRWDIGVQTVYTANWAGGDSTEALSEVNWSSDATDNADMDGDGLPDPFGIEYIVIGTVKNLRAQ